MYIQYLSNYTDYTFRKFLSIYFRCLQHKLEYYIHLGIKEAVTTYNKMCFICIGCLTSFTYIYIVLIFPYLLHCRSLRWKDPSQSDKDTGGWTTSGVYPSGSGWVVSVLKYSQTCLTQHLYLPTLVLPNLCYTIFLSKYTIYSLFFCLLCEITPYLLQQFFSQG